MQKRVSVGGRGNESTNAGTLAAASSLSSTSYGKTASRLRSTIAERKARETGALRRRTAIAAVSASELARIRAALDPRATETAPVVDQLVRDHAGRARALPLRNATNYDARSVARRHRRRRVGVRFAPNRLDRYARRIARQDLGDALRSEIPESLVLIRRALAAVDSVTGFERELCGALAELADRTLYVLGAARLPHTLASNFKTLLCALATTAGSDSGSSITTIDCVRLIFDYWQAIVSWLITGSRDLDGGVDGGVRITLDGGGDGGARLATEVAVQSHYIAAVTVAAAVQLRTDTALAIGVGARGCGGGGGDMSRDLLLLLYRLNGAHMMLTEFIRRDSRVQLSPPLETECRLVTALCGFSSVDLTTALASCYALDERTGDRDVRRRKAMLIEWIHRCLADAGRGDLGLKIANMRRSNDLGATRRDLRLRRAVCGLVWDEFVALHQAGSTDWIDRFCIHWNSLAADDDVKSQRVIFALAKRAERQLEMRLQSENAGVPNTDDRRQRRRRLKKPAAVQVGTLLKTNREEQRRRVTAVNVAIAIGCMCNNRRELRDAVAGLRDIAFGFSCDVYRSGMHSSLWFAWTGTLCMLIDVLYALGAYAECIAVAINDCRRALEAHPALIYTAPENDAAVAVADRNVENGDFTVDDDDDDDAQMVRSRAESLKQRHRILLRHQAVVWLHEFRRSDNGMQRQRRRRRRSLDRIVAECVERQMDSDATVLGAWYRDLVAARLSLPR